MAHAHKAWDQYHGWAASRLFSRTVIQNGAESAILSWPLAGNTHGIFFAAKWNKRRNNWGIDLSRQQLLLCIGATGDIGSAVCRWLEARTEVADYCWLRVTRATARVQAELGREARLWDWKKLPPCWADIISLVASSLRELKLTQLYWSSPCLLIDGWQPSKTWQTKSIGVYVLNGGIVFLDIDWRIMKVSYGCSAVSYLLVCRVNAAGIWKFVPTFLARTKSDYREKMVQIGPKS